MNNDEAAKELAKVFKDVIAECLDVVIEQRCYLSILAMLNRIKPDSAFQDEPDNEGE